PTFPESVPGAIDDRALEASWQLDVTTVATLLRMQNGKEAGRLEGWERGQWEAFTGVDGLGAGLPAYRPGCGSRTLDPGVIDELMVRFGAAGLLSRRVALAHLADAMEAPVDR